MQPRLNTTETLTKMTFVAILTLTRLGWEGWVLCHIRTFPPHYHHRLVIILPSVCYYYGFRCELTSSSPPVFVRLFRFWTPPSVPPPTDGSTPLCVAFALASVA